MVRCFHDTGCPMKNDSTLDDNHFGSDRYFYKRFSVNGDSDSLLWECYAARSDIAVFWSGVVSKLSQFFKKYHVFLTALYGVIYSHQSGRCRCLSLIFFSSNGLSKVSMMPYHQNFSGICPHKTEIKWSANAMKQGLSMCFFIMSCYGPLKTESQKSTFQSSFFVENSVILWRTKYSR